MTEASAAQHEIVGTPRISMAALCAVRELVDTALSCLEPTVGEGGSNANAQDSAGRVIRRDAIGRKTNITGGRADGGAATADTVAARTGRNDDSGDRQ